MMKNVYLLGLLLLTLAFNATAGPMIQLGSVEVSVAGRSGTQPMYVYLRDSHDPYSAISFSYIDEDGHDVSVILDHDAKAEAKAAKKKVKPGKTPPVVGANNQFRAALQKFVEWRQIAIDEGLSIDRTINDSIATRGVWRSISDNYYSAARPHSISLSLQNFSDSSYKLMIFVRSMQASTNRYISIETAGIFLEPKSVERLIMLMDPATIAVRVDEALQKAQESAQTNKALDNIFT